MQELKEHLEKLAKREAWTDDEDFNAYDFSGGNVDDAHSHGMDDGETLMARDLLAKFFTK